MSQALFLEDFSSEWFGEGPRSLGTPEQRLIYDHDELSPWFEQSGRPVFLSVNPYTLEGRVRCIERLFFDFDDKARLSRAWEDASRFSMNLKRFYDIESLLVYSGKKGYHVYVYLQEPTGHNLPEDRLKELYRRLQEMLLGRSDYPTFDRQVFGDVKRIARVPYSLHQDTKQRATPVNRDHAEVLLLPGFTSGLRRFGVSPQFVELALRIRQPPKRAQTEKRKSGPGQLRPCMRTLLEARSVHDPEHKLKVCLVAELSAEGKTRDQIIDVFRGMEGFSESKTVEQVDHALRRGYRPFRCKTIKDLGGCLGSSCRIYRKRGETP